ncbi:MAG: hypothetical protein AAGC68_13930, partial [Verrucomicrobiota bacterium]
MKSPLRIIIGALLLTGIVFAAFRVANTTKEPSKPKNRTTESTAPEEEKTPTGVVFSDQELHDGGFVLFAPMLTNRVFLIDYAGQVRHVWRPAFRPGRTAYLLDDGNLLFAGRARPYPPMKELGGLGGRLQKIAPDGEVLWDHFHGGPRFAAHHDICPLPNGNVLALVYERVPRQRAIELGRDPESVSEEGVVIDTIV